jgi:integrase
MSVYKRGDSYHYEFLFAGKRIRESAHTPSKTVAKEAEKNRRRELERTLAGLPAADRMDRIKSVAEVVKAYLESYSLAHRAKSVLFARGRLAHVSRILGTKLLPDLTEGVIHSYMRTRVEEKVSGRTINMELGELSRAIGHPWSVLWPKVRKMEERKDVGKALSPEEERRLLDAVTSQTSHSRSQTLGTFIRVALMTGMRSGEILGLTWGQIDFGRRVITVGRAKTSSGTGRQIPMNGDLFAVLSIHATWAGERFKALEPGHHLFPFGKPTPTDPTKPMTDITSAWDALRERAKVQCRLHDLRHTAATKMAEAGIPESTMLALMGHMSRAMLERYSHIRMAAKREAVEALSAPKAKPNSEGVPTKSPTEDAQETVHYA